jgi:hypothetical protein
MIQQLERPITACPIVLDEETVEVPTAFFRGVLSATGLALPMWGAGIWLIAKIT